MAINSELVIKSQVTDDGDGSPLIGSVKAVMDYDKTMADGTGASQADVLFRENYAIAASGTQLLDLAGTLTDQWGRTATFVKVKSIIVKNTNSVAGDSVTIAPDATNGVAFDCDANIGPLGVFVLSSPVDGLAVTAGTADELILTETGGVNTVNVEVTIVGTSA